MRTSLTRKVWSCLIFCLLGITSIKQPHAQTFTNKVWSHTFGTPDTFAIASSAIGLNGNIANVGNTMTAGGHTDVIVTLFDTDGLQLWQQTLGGTATGNDYGIAVRVDASGDVIVASMVQNTGTGQDIAIAKYKSTGTLDWYQEWNGPDSLDDFPVAIAVDGNGDIYVAGASKDSTTLEDYVVLRYSSSGSLIWTAGYNYNNLQDYAASLVLDNNGNPVVTGASANSATAWDYATIIFDKSSGAQIAVNRVGFPGIGIDEPSAIAKDAAGNIVVVGSADSNGNKNIKIARFSPQLALLWTQSFDGAGLEDKGLSIGVTDSGHIYIAGYTERSASVYDFITLKYDSTGSLLWSQDYRSAVPGGSARASQLAVTANGGCKVVGAVMNNIGNMELRAIGYSASGELDWVQAYDGPGNDGATSVLVDGNSVYVSGISQTLVGNNYAIIDYTTFTDTNGYHLNSSGRPDYIDHEVIVSFRPGVVKSAFVSNRDLQFARLQDAVADSVVDAMSTALGVNLWEQGLTAIKIHQWMTPADSISISRLGEVVKMDKHWSSFVITLPTTMNVVNAANALSTLQSVIRYAEPNYIGWALSIPDDSLCASHQANLVLSTNPSYANAHISMDGAWDIETGDTSIRVGVYDAAIYWEHPDFGHNSPTGTKIKGGYNYVTNMNALAGYPPQSNNTHGTKTAGIIGALRNNVIGIAGIAGGDLDSGNTGVSLYSLVLFAPGGTWSAVVMSRAAQAIVRGASSTTTDGYALHVQNHSWGTGDTVVSKELTRAVKTAFLNHCALVAARGNDTDEDPDYPATFRDDWIMSVGASGTDGTSQVHGNGDNYYTAFGRAMDFLAPGSENLVYTTTVPIQTILGPQGYYDKFSGTSAASPHVAGVAALMLSRHDTSHGAPNKLAPEDIENVLQNTATDIDDTAHQPWPFYPGYDLHSAWGRINATAALQAVDVTNRYVLHPATAPATTAISSWWPADSNVYFPYGIDTLPQGPGIYKCKRRTITRNYSIVLPSSYGAISVWLRHSSSLGADVRLDSNDGYDRHAFLTYTINGNVVNVTTKSYVYYVNYKVGTPNQPIGITFPCLDTQTKAAFSIHVSRTPVNSVPELQKKGGFIVFPNPTNLGAILRYRGEILQSPTVEVVDMLGRTVHRQSIPGNHRQFEAILPSSSWTSGLYLCKLHSDNGRIILTHKISKY